MDSLKVLSLIGNPVVGKIRYYRKIITLKCPQLTYLDDRPVFPQDRAAAEAWERGGEEAEKKSREDFRKLEDQKIMDSVNALMHMVKKNRKRKEDAEEEWKNKKDVTDASNVEKEPNQEENDNSSAEDDSEESLLSEEHFGSSCSTCSGSTDLDGDECFKKKPGRRRDPLTLSSKRRKWPYDKKKVDEEVSDNENLPRKKNDFSKVNFDNLFDRAEVNNPKSEDVNEVPPLEEFEEGDIELQNVSEGQISLGKLNEEYFKTPNKEQTKLGDFECTAGTSDDNLKEKRELSMKDEESSKNSNDFMNMLSFAYKAGATDGNYQNTLQYNSDNNRGKKDLVKVINEPSSYYNHNDSNVEGIYRQSEHKTINYSDIFNISEDSKRENKNQVLVNAFKRKQLITEIDSEQTILSLPKNKSDIQIENESENRSQIPSELSDTENDQENIEVSEEPLTNNNIFDNHSANNLPEFHLVESHMNDLKKLMKQYNKLDQEGLSKENISEFSKQNQPKIDSQEYMLDSDKRELEGMEKTHISQVDNHDLPSPVKHVEVLDKQQSNKSNEKQNMLQFLSESSIQETVNLHSTFNEKSSLSSCDMQKKNFPCNVLQDINAREDLKQCKSNVNKLNNESQIEINIESLINSYSELTINESTPEQFENALITDNKMNNNTIKNTKTEIITISEKINDDLLQSSIKSGSNKIKIYEDTSDNSIVSDNKRDYNNVLINYNTINEEKSSTESKDIINGLIEDIYNTFLDSTNDDQTEKLYQVIDDKATERREEQETTLQINKGEDMILKQGDNPILVYDSDDEDELNLLRGYSGPISFDNILLKRYQCSKTAKKSNKSNHDPKNTNEQEVRNKSLEKQEGISSTFPIFGRLPVNQCTYEIGELETNEQNIPETKTYEIYVEDEDKIESYASNDNDGISCETQDRAIEKYNKSCKESEKIMEEIKKMILESGTKNESTEGINETTNLESRNSEESQDQQMELDNFNKTEILYNNYISNTQDITDVGNEHAIISEHCSLTQHSEELHLKIINENTNMTESGEEKNMMIQGDEHNEKCPNHMKYNKDSL